MSPERTVVIVGRSGEFDRALDALSGLDLVVHVIPTLPEAERALLGAGPPLVGAVLVGLERSAAQGPDLLRSLRGRGGLNATPIAVWAPADSAHLLWAMANEPPLHEALA